MSYLAFKAVHESAAALSIVGFAARGIASFVGAPWVRGRLAKTLPHIVDTVLLLSALALVWTLRLTPDRAPWLISKIAGVLVYIALGVVALRPGRPRTVQVTAWLAAVVTFAWIVSVAFTKNPFGFFG